MAGNPDAAPILAQLNAFVVHQKQLIAAIRHRRSYRSLGIMANQGLIDLQTAVAAFQAFATTVAAELTTLEAAAANATGDPDADVETLAQQVNASIATIKAAMPPATP